MASSMKILCLLIFFIVGNPCVYAQLPANPIIYSGEEVLDISDKVNICIKQKDNKACEPVLNKAKNSNLGFVNTTVVVNFSIKNMSDKAEVLLELPYPLMDSLKLMKIEQGEQKLIGVSGDCLPISKRTLRHQNHVFYLEIEKGEQEDYVLYINVAQPFYMPLRLTRNSNIFHRYLTFDVFYGIYFGFACILLIYFVIFSIYLKESLFGLYALYILSVAVTQASLDGYLYRFFDSVWLSTHIEVFACVITIVMLRFTYIFLELKHASPFYKHFHRWYNIVPALMAIFSLLGMQVLAFKITNTSAGVFLLYFVVVGTLQARKGVYNAKFFLMAFSPFAIGMAFFVLRSEGVLPYNTFTSYSMVTGSALELLLLSLGVGSQALKLKKEKQDIEKSLTTLLQNQNQLLEAEVASKTEDLHQVNNELKTRMLSAQMNPHFIFNVLNSIQSFVLNEKREEAGKYMAKFSRLMRFYLTGSLKRFISLKDELEALERYLELEMLRYTGGFNYKLEVDEKLPVDNMEVPGMLVMPFLENAIWHGVMEHKKGGLIEVFFVRKGEGCEVTIRDNGIGIEESKKRKQNEVDHESVGMKITEERLKLIHQELKTAYKFEVKQISSPDTGTKVSFTMPYKMKKT